MNPVHLDIAPGARLHEPQQPDGRGTWKLFPSLVLPGECCGSRTRAPQPPVCPWAAEVAP